MKNVLIIYLLQLIFLQPKDRGCTCKTSLSLSYFFSEERIIKFSRSSVTELRDSPNVPRGHRPLVISDLDYERSGTHINGMRPYREVARQTRDMPATILCNMVLASVL